MATGQSEAVMKAPAGLLQAVTAAGVSDGELLARFTADRDELAEIAFSTLVCRHGPMILHVCQQIVGDRHTAEDAFQATFLILARKAGSIRQPELLAHWLHGVALRTAREARMRDHRRRRRESPRIDGTETEPIDDGTPEKTIVFREELELLHEEVSRLPERYRIPVVLCDLEGLTYQEAAHRLRCPVSTIGVRLKRARERLRARLTQRGVAPEAGLIGALVGAEAASAHVSSSLVDTTVQAAMGFAVKTVAPNGLASAAVIALTESVLKTMALTRLRLTIGVVALALLTTATIGWVGAHRGITIPPPPGRMTALPYVQAKPENNQGAHEPSARVSTSEALPLEKPVAASLAGRAPVTPAAADQLTAASTLPDRLFSSSRKREEEMAKASPVKATTPAPVPAANAGQAIADEQRRGELLFTKEWAPNDPLSRGGDGLGPVYNDTSCVACHGLGAPGGAGPESKNVVLVTAIPNNCGPAQPLEQLHPGFRGSRSAVLHRHGTDPAYASWRQHFADPSHNPQQSSGPNQREESIQNRIKAVKEQTAPGRRVRERSGNLPSMNGFSLSLAERNTPALFGAGHIDEIPSEVLVAVAACQSAEVKGRVGRTKEGRIGRFGWKAQLPSLHEFVRGACANELGLEVPGNSQAASPLAPFKKANALDLDEADCDALVSYIRALPAPVEVDPAGPIGTDHMRAGRRLFADLECGSCHMPTLGGLRGIYSDLLLHDMGQSLSDSGSTYGIDGPNTPEGPTAREWRTPPLWGYRDSGPYMHDGRAQNLEEVVAFHEGQANASAKRFFSLSALERDQVEAFLKSLVAPSAARGVVLAAELEFRIEQEERREPEDLVRRRREQAVARDEQKWREALRHRRAQDAAKRARVQIPIAQNLEKMGKITGALAFYEEIARLAAGTDEGRLAVARIAELSSQRGVR
jgi:RNA polymerase sigma factor (sigma-70 family)